MAAHYYFNKLHIGVCLCVCGMRYICVCGLCICVCGIYVCVMYICVLRACVWHVCMHAVPCVVCDSSGGGVCVCILGVVWYMGMCTVCVWYLGRAHACVCMNVYAGSHACVCTGGSQSRTLDAFLCCFLLYPLETKLLSELEACCCLARLGCPARSQDPLISALSSGVTGMHGCFQLLCGCRRCKLRFLTLTQQALLCPEQSPQRLAVVI